MTDGSVCFGTFPCLDFEWNSTQFARFGGLLRGAVDFLHLILVKLVCGWKGVGKAAEVPPPNMPPKRHKIWLTKTSRDVGEVSKAKGLWLCLKEGRTLHLKVPEDASAT